MGLYGVATVLSSNPSDTLRQSAQVIISLQKFDIDESKIRVDQTG